MTTSHEDVGTAEVTAPAEHESVEDAAERIFAMCLAGAESMSMYLGDRLGYYRSLVTDGPATPTELAQRTGTAERYAREWLEQQAVCGLLVAIEDPAGRRFELTPAVAEVLTDETSLAFLGPLPRMIAAAVTHLPELLEAYRTGGGVSWEQLGADARESQAALNRPWFEGQLADALRGVPELHEVLSQPGARILDIGCGGGWSSVALARAYPASSVDGVDIDAASVEMARDLAERSGLADRVSFRHGDAARLAGESPYDAAFAFECVHDMPRPHEVLAAAREAVRADGLVVVMDEAVADEFTAPGDELERFMYAASLFVCLPDGLSSPPSRATGTVMRRSTLTTYAREAGFEDVDVLPIEDFSFFRFYSLR
jgi:SAM-dependent methyltransferase